MGVDLITVYITLWQSISCGVKHSTYFKLYRSFSISFEKIETLLSNLFQQNLLLKHYDFL